MQSFDGPVKRRKRPGGVRIDEQITLTTGNQEGNCKSTLKLDRWIALACICESSLPQAAWQCKALTRIGYMPLSQITITNPMCASFLFPDAASCGIIELSGVKSLGHTDLCSGKAVFFVRLIGNLLWILLGGLISALAWLVVGCLWCVTVVGIPVGLQCFKLSSISLNPFGKEIIYEGGAISFLLNVVWFVFGGLEMALVNFMIGLLLCVTIVGIPFGKQFFKIAKLALRPFGAVVEREHYL